MKENDMHFFHHFMTNNSKKKHTPFMKMVLELRKLFISDSLSSEVETENVPAWWQSIMLTKLKRRLKIIQITRQGTLQRYSTYFIWTLLDIWKELGTWNTSTIFHDLMGKKWMGHISVCDFMLKRNKNDRLSIKLKKTNNHKRWKWTVYTIVDGKNHGENETKWVTVNYCKSWSVPEDGMYLG